SAERVSGGDPVRFGKKHGEIGRMFAKKPPPYVTFELGDESVRQSVSKEFAALRKPQGIGKLETPGSGDLDLERVLLRPIECSRAVAVVPVERKEKAGISGDHHFPEDSRRSWEDSSAVRIFSLFRSR